MFATTLRSIAAPRRALPIGLVVAALVAVEAAYGPGRAGLVPLAMSIAFLVLAPWSWRVVAPRGQLVAAAALAAEAIAVVGLIGRGLPALLATGPTFMTDDGSLAVAAVLFVVGGWGLGRDIELEHDLAHVRLKALRTHLDPHFLYNTLNAIMEWCAEDPRIAEDAIGRLAAMLRTTLEALEQTSWPLGRELAMVEDLLELHRIRDVSAFTVTLTCTAEARAIAIPPLILVAIVENALKHGPRAGHHGAVAIDIARAGGMLRCTVGNPGRFAPGTGGRGLQTLHSRLALAYGRRARFAIDADGDRTRAVLELPA